MWNEREREAGVGRREEGDGGEGEGWRISPIEHRAGAAALEGTPEGTIGLADALGLAQLE